MSKVKIIVCCHKPGARPEDEAYLPLQVGRAVACEDMGIAGDDTGDNISSRNSLYCELTGLYWAWKNLSDADVVGLCHYRRYFDFHGKCSRWSNAVAIADSDFSTIDFTIDAKTAEQLKSGRAIVARPWRYRYSLMIDYCLNHNSSDFRTLEQVIAETQPDYREAFYRTMYMGNRLYPYNMLMMCRKDFDAYCSWLFAVLEQVEQRGVNEPRSIGFMGERLLGVWLAANKIKTITRPVICITDSAVQIGLLPPRLQMLHRIQGWLTMKIWYPVTPKGKF